MFNQNGQRYLGKYSWLSQGELDGVFSLHGTCTINEGCLIPETVLVSDITTSSATISWNGWDDASEYILEYGSSGFTPGVGTQQTIPGGTTTIDLEDLEMLTTYDVYIKTICADGESINTVPITFNTSDIYCDVDVTNIIEPITHVAFAGIDNSIDAEIEGTPAHMYFLDQTAEVSTGESYTIIVEGNTNGYTNGLTAFIDWNQDGNLNNTSERYDIGTIANSTGTDGIQATTVIDVPEGAATGITRLWIMKEDYSTSNYPENACSYIGWGQIHEYTVNVQESVGISEFDKFDFSFGPNPSTGSVELNASAAIEEVSFYNLLGQKVLENDVRANSTRLDVSALSAGNYLMEVKIDGERKTFKILKD